jgi:hypothetical protein
MAQASGNPRREKAEFCFDVIASQQRVRAEGQAPRSNPETAIVAMISNVDDFRIALKLRLLTEGLPSGLVTMEAIARKLALSKSHALTTNRVGEHQLPANPEVSSSGV